MRTFSNFGNRAQIANIGKMGMLSLVAAPSLRGGWDPRLAAEYLDSRHKEWLPAKATGGTCLSCYPVATYLLARPALRRTLRESQPTSYETDPPNSLRSTAGLMDAKDIFPAFAKAPPASQFLGVEAVYAALFLAQADAGKATLNAYAQNAFDRLWPLQFKEGPAKGAWQWLTLGLVRERTADLKAYFACERESQPPQNRLMLVWASTKLVDAMPGAARRSTIDEIGRKQEANGRWTIQSLAPRKEHPPALVSTGSNSCASALVTFVLETQDIAQVDPRLARERAWLASHQAHQGGYWAADSMNKQYPPGSMQERFMREATAFAAMALSATSGSAKK